MSYKVIGGAIAAVVAVLLPFGAGEYQLFVVTLIAIYALAGLGLTVLTGWTGQIALAHAGFMAVGAYGTAILNAHGVSWPIAVIAATGACGATGVLVGLPAVRLRGLYLAIATLAFAELAVQGLNSWTSVTGGASGFSIRPFLLFALSPTVSIYYLSMAVASLGYMLVCTAGRRAWGRQLKAVRDIETATGAMGISATRFKLASFAASAAIAGLAGALFGQLLGFLSPSTFDVPLMVQLLVIVFVGGIQWARGAVLGAFIVVALRQSLQDFGSWQTLTYSLLLLVVLLAMPGGLAGGWYRAGMMLRDRSRAGKPTAKPDADFSRHTPAKATVEPAEANLDGPAVLSVRGLRVAFGGNVAIDDVDLDFPVGFTGLLGPNGAGKTTLFNAISGYLTHASGDIRLGELQLLGRSARSIAHAGIARTFQTPRLVPELTVLENVILGSDGHRGDRCGRREAIELLTAFSLRALADVPASEVPLPTLKVVELVRSLMARPELLLLDEPAAGLSADEVDALLIPLCALMQSSPLAVVIVEHDLELIARLCAGTYMLDFGRIIASGPPRDVLQRPEVLSAYLGAGFAAIS